MHELHAHTLNFGEKNQKLLLFTAIEFLLGGSSPYGSNK